MAGSSLAAYVVDDFCSMMASRAVGVVGVDGEDGFGALFKDGFDGGDGAGLFFGGRWGWRWGGDSPPRGRGCRRLRRGGGGPGVRLLRGC